MAYRNLRALMKTMAPPQRISLKNCNVVIDGKSFFKKSYKSSGCHSLLGGEYDRYADHLRKLLKPFIECNVTCFVIFNGCMDADLDRRTEIHQNIINRIDAINPEDDNSYCEPILLKDVVKEILTELGIKYYVTENDHRRVMLSVADYFGCPIITKNYEYSLLYVSCVNSKSLLYDVDNQNLSCDIFKTTVSRKNFGIKHNLLPLFFTLLDEQCVCFKKLTLIIIDLQRPKLLLRKVVRWTRQQADNLQDALDIIKGILTDDEWTEFMTAYEANVELCINKKYRAVFKYFSTVGDGQVSKGHFDWFKKSVGNGKLAVSYINLRKKETFSGSWVVFDKEQEDAMMPALDIVFYVKRYLDNKLVSKITFVGRQEDKSCAWEISKIWKYGCPKQNLFMNFLNEILPGFHMKLLEQIPKDCWVLIMTLLYYSQKKMDANFIYCVLLSYVMLGPVSENVGVIKRSNFMCHENAERKEDKADCDGLNSQDCTAAVESMMDLFYVKRLKNINRKLLQALAEFQHCLQHMNYMNKLFGSSVQGTNFHKTLNATFVYNIYMKLKGKTCAVDYFKKRLRGSSVFKSFKKVVYVFEACVASGMEERMKNLQVEE